jgi:hypothetical protein
LDFWKNVISKWEIKRSQKLLNKYSVGATAASLRIKMTNAGSST